MNKKKLYLHIGTHKTGSTALQVFLTQNRQSLLKNGILYPEVGCPKFSQYGQHQLAWLFFSNENYLPCFEGNTIDKHLLEDLDILNKINLLSSDKKIHSIIISSEEFSILNLDEIQMLSKKLYNFDVEIIIYLRRQDNYLEAAYGTSVLFSGYNKNFPSFMSNQRMNLNYYEVIKNWETSFGSCVHVRSYEDMNIKKDIISDFSKIININHNDQYISNKSRVNKSISADAMEVIRGLRLRGWTENRLKLVREKFDKIYSSYNKKDLGGFINEKQYIKLKDLYNDNNKKLEKEYSCSLTYEEEYKTKKAVEDFEISLVNVFSDIMEYNEKEVN